ncbi:unnamed protein product [Nezara viridula]|uniref:Cystatin domain-containing protein n=1 Tax=Nezara viridula TaxID=85310 RepID=A0A9P0H8V8_NEZVI|nr:unnamed protein product [Nezara viridula]
MSALVILLFVTQLLIEGTKQACPGCPVDGNPEDKDIKYFLNKAIEKINTESKIVEPKKVVKILSVKQQVVSGVMFNITYIAEGKLSKKDYMCRIVLLDEPWVSEEPQVLERHCTPIAKKKNDKSPHGTQK